MPFVPSSFWPGAPSGILAPNGYESESNLMSCSETLSLALMWQSPSIETATPRRLGSLIEKDLYKKPKSDGLQSNSVITRSLVWSLLLESKQLDNYCKPGGLWCGKQWQARQTHIIK